MWTIVSFCHAEIYIHAEILPTAYSALLISVKLSGIIYFNLKDILPNSWGNSSHMTATEMLTPASILSEKAAPIDKPSIKLWRPSPNMIIHATVPIVDCPFSKCTVCSWWWEWCDRGICNKVKSWETLLLVIKLIY